MVIVLVYFPLILETDTFVDLILSKKPIIKIGDKIGPIAMHSAVAVMPPWLIKRAYNINYWFNYHKWNFAQEDELTVFRYIFIE